MNPTADLLSSTSETPGESIPLRPCFRHPLSLPSLFSVPFHFDSSAMCEASLGLPKGAMQTQVIYILLWSHTLKAWKPSYGELCIQYQILNIDYQILNSDYITGTIGKINCIFLGLDLGFLLGLDPDLDYGVDSVFRFNFL